MDVLGAIVVEKWSHKVEELPRRKVVTLVLNGVRVLYVEMARRQGRRNHCKKIQKHTKSQAHIAAGGILDEKEERKGRDSITQKCCVLKRTDREMPPNSIFYWVPKPSIHRLPKHSRSSKQKWNRVHSIRYTCTEMIECIADNMRKKLRSTIRDNERLLYYY